MRHCSVIKPAASGDAYLEAVTGAIVAAFEPRRIVLFGSRARGDVHGDSDYDLMVELPRVDDERATAWAIKDAIPKGTRVDITVRTPARFEERRDDPGTLDWDISREGVVIYPPGADSQALRPAPRVREKEGPPKSVGEWLRTGDIDVTVVEQLLAQQNVAWPAICFHAQQAGEKYLKALLVHLRVRPERTHDLSKLLRELRKTGLALEGLDGDCELLAKYPVEPRYPSEMVADREQGVAAADAMRRVVETVRDAMRV